VARNRKRAKERRSQRPQRPPGSRPGAAPARSNGHEDHDPKLTGPEGIETPEDIATPRDTATPREIEIEAQESELELELPDDVPASLEHATPDAEIADAQIALGAAEASELGPEEPPRRRRGRAPKDEEEDDEDLEVVSAARAPAGPRLGRIHRLVNFVQGSWRELQRVQWPDRRQVMQATGVVIGFVIVAGVFLGVSDWLAGKLVNFILK
jgi:preprotein translocase SecE subunit